MRDSMPSTHQSIPRSDWATRLKAFTARNASRPAVLEDDDLEWGVQHDRGGLPLRGVTYDTHDGNVEIMLGNLVGTAQHHTRSIEQPKSIDLVFDADGRDEVLRVAHARGQTLLTFQR
jgi:Family of unknown function (DUF5335)